MAKLKRRRKKNGTADHLHHVTCKYCIEWQEAKANKTKTVLEKARPKDVKGNLNVPALKRLCGKTGNYIGVDDKACNDFQNAAYFFCEKFSCQMVLASHAITCYARRHRNHQGCLRCRQFTKIVAQITKQPMKGTFDNRKNCLIVGISNSDNPIVERQPGEPIRLLRRRRKRPQPVLREEETQTNTIGNRKLRRRRKRR